MSQKRVLMSLVCIMFCFVLIACGGSEGSRKVKIAVSLPLGVDLGKDMLEVAKLALNEANSKVGKTTVELLVLSSSEPGGHPVSPDAERKAAEQAIADPAVVAYLGGVTSDQSKAAMPLLNAASIVQISPSATWPGLTKPGYGPGEPGIYYPTGRRHFFRVVPSDEIQGAAAARWAKQLGFQTIFIVDDGTAYGRGIAGLFEVTAKDLGINILGHETLSKTITKPELKTLAARVVDLHPTLLYFGGGVEPWSEFIGMARRLDRTLSVMGPDALVYEELFTRLGSALLVGVYATTGTIPADQLNSPVATTFLEKYRSTYNRMPFPMIANTYEAMKVLLSAIEHAKKPTREGVLEAMRDLGSFSGILGSWHFNEWGDTSITTIGGMQVRNGAWTFVRVVK